MIGLEDELARIREENDVGKDVQQEKVEKLTKRLQLMKQRYESLEQRRGLEVEGFKNDVKILRTRLKDVEKKLFKVNKSRLVFYGGGGIFIHCDTLVFKDVLEKKAR